MREHVLVVDHEKEIFEGLQVERRGVRRSGDVFCKLGLFRITHVDDAEAFEKMWPIQA
jgi:hypothetical protein